MHTDDWMGLYRKGWGQNRLRPASFAHPAKCSYGLSVHIYEHALEEGWIESGGIVLDPFAGIGGFALEAMRHGLHFVGVELEQRFVDMGQGCDCTGIGKADWVRFQGRWDRARYQDGWHWCPECIMKASAVAGERKFKVAEKRKIKPLPLPGTKWGALAKTRQATIFDAAPSASYVRNSGQIPCTGPHRYHGNIETWEQDGMPGTAVIVQGDSRRLSEVLEQAQLCLSSPPFGNTLGKGGETKGFHSYDKDEAYNRCKRDYVIPDDPANLGNLPDTGFEAALALASPVYASGCTHTGGDDLNPDHVQGGEVHHVNYGSKPGQLAQMPEGDLVAVISSPPFIASIHEGGHGINAGKLTGNKAGPNSQALIMDGYGREPGQLAALPEGSHAEACERPAIAISSPPWQESLESKDTKFQASARPGRTIQCADYGSEPGQLAQMPPGDHAAALEAGAETGRAELCLSSPPFEGSLNSTDIDFIRNRLTTGPSGSTKLRGAKGAASDGQVYGSTVGQLGQQQGSTFWAASREILEQVYQVLAPGAHAIWVLKMFVRSGRLVDFPGQWEALCQSVGFKTVCKHRAWMNKDAGIVQTTLDGEEMSMEKWFKSFFRRLCESKGSPRIDWELVLCMVKE